MVVRGEQGGGLRGEGCWGCGRFGEGRRVALVGYDAVEGFERRRLAAPVRRRRGFETEF